MSAVEHAVNATRLSTLDLQRNITALELATVGLEQRAHAAEKALEEALQEAGRLRARVEELNPRVVTIGWVNDEVVDILLDGDELISVNHDEQGWDGMRAAIDLAKAFARKLGAEVRTEGVPNL